MTHIHGCPSPADPSLKPRALEILRSIFGYSSFRPGQWEIIENILLGRDCVVLMPTGGGKSLCFQIPALMSDGCCIVVSPLIALMSDQVGALQTNRIPAAAINSTQPESENRLIYQRAAAGEIKLLYISPERLLTDIEEISKRIKVSFFAVDEAHCISQWGHDFRPVYTSLSIIKTHWPIIPVMALTATADRLTRQDISRALGLADPFYFISSFDRPNLSLQVIQGANLATRVGIIGNLIERYPLDSGIVYCLSRKKTETMASLLNEAGYKVGYYHAGMLPAEREKVQQRFLCGELQAICATVAFGMGIDKSNIRWVAHNNIPGNIESYYQEIGRAGRDGLPAETILFYSYADILARQRFAEESGQREINNSKLDFMQKYAEASVCRRRILLSYFSEETTADCGNCDNCKNPRPQFDGTVLAQKVLSAIIRTGGNESLGTIIEILRGMRSQSIIAKGYDRLPTFGVGADLTPALWQAYILQMQQLGLLEVAYDRNFHLIPTDMGMRVVRSKEKISLVQYNIPSYVYRKSPKSTITTITLSPEEIITNRLKSLRTSLASKLNSADYAILSDVTISAIAAQKPTDVDALYKIEGISLSKLDMLYKDILQAVKKGVENRKKIPHGASDAVSRIMFQSGMSVGEIVALRHLKPTTIFNHLINEFAKGEEIDLKKILPIDDFNQICAMFEPIAAIKETEPDLYKIQLDQFKEQLPEFNLTPEDFHKAIAIWRVAEVVNGEYHLKATEEDDASEQVASEPEVEYDEDAMEHIPQIDQTAEEDIDTDFSEWE